MENVLLWDENKVGKWIASIGYAAYEKHFKENGITGDVLVNLDHETLKDLSMHSVGQRMDFLRHVYNLKALWRIPLNEWDYVPPSILYENDWLGQNGMADYRKIEAAFQERDGHLRQLTEDVNRLANEVNRLREEMSQIWKASRDKKPLPVFEIEKSPSTPPVQKGYPQFISKSGHLLTPPTVHNLGGSVDYFTHTSNNDASKSGKNVESAFASEDHKTIPGVTINDGGAIKVYGEKISNSSKVDLETSKNVRLLLDDACSKVIMSALKKYNVMDDWQQYALWLQWGPPDNTQERPLGYDEKPLRISHKLKESKQNPRFVLKHVKDNKPFMPPSSDKNAFTSPRPAPRPSTPLYSDDQSQQSAPAAPYSSSGWKSSSNDKQRVLEPKTAITSGRVGFEVIAPVMSSSISTPTPSTNTSSSNTLTPTAEQSSSTNTPTSSKRAGTINRKPSDNFLSELGLESDLASAIYSIMMDNDNSSSNK